MKRKLLGGLILVVLVLLTLFSASMADERLLLSLEDGDIVISATGYTVGGGAEQPYMGPYTLHGAGETDNTITILAGTHDIAIENINIKTNRGAAVLIEEHADVHLLLLGENTAESKDGYAGIQLVGDERSSSLTIVGSGSLTARGGDDGAGIGGGAKGSNGTVTIESGTIFAYGGDGGAGIGGGGNASSYKEFDCGGGAIAIHGGEITAVGGDGGAGIGGGNHGDGGTITIDGGTIVLAQGGGGGAGIGSGLGSHVKSDKGPGYYSGGAITLTGEYLIERALGGGNAAGIGGGMYADSGTVSIRGGEIVLAKGGDGTEGSLHHGAAGIGAGYQGHCNVVIRFATIRKAVGSGSAAGIGSGAAANTIIRGNPTVWEQSHIDILGTDIDLAQGGPYGGAGIGGGSFTDEVDIVICGRRIIAKGGDGGAGIGSGAYLNISSKYAHATKLTLNLQCGIIEAEGGGEDTESVGGGTGNDDADITVNEDANLDGTQTNFIKVASTGYLGYYDGNAYNIQVQLGEEEEANITYSEEEEGIYGVENPTYTEVGEHLVYYHAQVERVTYAGSNIVHILPLEEPLAPTEEPSPSEEPLPTEEPSATPTEELWESARAQPSEGADTPAQAAEASPKNGCPVGNGLLGGIKEKVCRRLRANCSPKTGDSAYPLLYLAGICVGIGAFLLYTIYKRKK